MASQQGENGEDLLLYYHPASSFSQKVVMALHEKNLNFTSRTVSIFTGEQLELWFMKLNPKGKVPVLQHNQKIICESADIISYLEETYCSEGVPKLIPSDQAVAQMCNVYRTLLDSLSIGIITFGSVLQPHLVRDSKMTEAEVAGRRQGLAKMLAAVQKAKTNHPEFQDEYEAKLNMYNHFSAELQKPETLIQELQKIEQAFDVMEAELALHAAEDCWLVCNDFTVADITLTLLLHRCKFLGYWHRFFDKGQRPFLQKYYERVRQRHSFQKTFPQ